jgi:hypothetical protein
MLMRSHRTGGRRSDGLPTPIVIVLLTSYAGVIALAVMAAIQVVGSLLP